MQINLEPSVLTNEVNAALHFFKFLKRMRILAVTDAPFYATLKNVKDMLETFQVRHRISLNVRALPMVIKTRHKNELTTER